MGVDYGGTRGTSPPPQNLERGNANANCPPPDFVRYKNERSVAFKIRQNPFLAGALPRTPLGELTTLPRPLCRLERGHPSPYPTLLGTDPPSALAMRPPEVQPDLRLCPDTTYNVFGGTLNLTRLLFTSPMQQKLFEVVHGDGLR